MSIHQRRLKIITFTLAGTDYSCQLVTWNLDPGFTPGDLVYTFCAAGEGQNAFVEDTDGKPSLQIKFFSDWSAGGISDYLAANYGTTVAFVLDHHPDVVGEHVRWNGNLVLVAPPVGGDARTTEQQDITMPIVGAPTYTRVG